MNPDHPTFADWDAAYVLGALSADDRRAFEAHLETCAECRRAVAELAPTVPLLARIPVADADRLGEEETDAAADAARGQLASLGRARARRRRRTWWAAGAAAAVIVAIAIAVPVTTALTGPPSTSFALEDVTDVSLQASVKLTPVAWGTKIDLDCRYPAGTPSPDMPATGWTYVLAVVGADGATSTVSTWRAGPGSTSRLSAGTALDVPGIRSVEIRTTSGVVLMKYDLSKIS